MTSVVVLLIAVAGCAAFIGMTIRHLDQVFVPISGFSFALAILLGAVLAVVEMWNTWES